MSLDKESKNRGKSLCPASLEKFERGTIPQPAGLPFRRRAREVQCPAWKCQFLIQLGICTQRRDIGLVRAPWKNYFLVRYR